MRMFFFFFIILIWPKYIYANNLNIQSPVVIELSPIDIILGGFDCSIRLPYSKKIYTGLEYSNIKYIGEYSQKYQLEYGVFFRFYPRLRLSSIKFFISLRFGHSKEFSSLHTRLKKELIDEMLLITQECAYKLSLSIGVEHKIFKFIYLVISTGVSFYDVPILGFSLKNIDYKEKSAYISTFFIFRLGVAKV